ncbi:hypothetical protein Acsp03_03540 [Actinomadura sp. NBRC 104412]|uniref:hypothetical protein n=1 Tax=Actinomadura sp. NBRC 104412 TaxID=3032203 RepID=UPI00249FA5D6|nr:hypothetical protein [Actinomadura sp. NBRC 104412]GLZ02887.1 hypothetical protein Acsp03_03540 [Actinomadura sp. NBRC 104412]
MRLRLAHGVVAAPGLAAWLPHASGTHERLAGDGAAPPGAAVALGPSGASDEEVRNAVTALRVLIADAGIVAAGAGVDLGAGFRSARLDGARGDQRDAVLAALKALGVEGAGRLGDRAGFLVALFGPAVTKRVGAAAARAVTEGRWAALHLASASSDILGPEQLERVLALELPEGVGDAALIGGGRPAVLAVNLRRLLAPVTGPRRLDLLLDLWDRVAAHHAKLIRRERLLDSQSGQDRLPYLRKRREHFEDQLLLREVTFHYGHEPSVLEAARWVPEAPYWLSVLHRLLRDALAATVLLHTAVAVVDHGLAEGLARSKEIIRAAADECSDIDLARAREKVPGLTHLPARPGCYLNDLRRKLDELPYEDGVPVLSRRNTAYVQQRLAHARDYALLAIEGIEELLNERAHIPEAWLRDWAASHLTAWRERIGYSTVRPPSEWTDVLAWTQHVLGEREPLATRLAEPAAPEAAKVEVVGDLLWYADLVDALAMLHGHESAGITTVAGQNRLVHDPVPSLDGVDDLARRHDSVTSAVSGAAQLTALGARAARGVRTWTEFVESLLADARLAEATGGGFPVPEPLSAVDGTIVPGTADVRFTLARDARTLAEWANYMGNCIAGEYYVEAAMKGRCALAALTGKGGRILANVELVPVRPGDQGWQIAEMAGRFNAQADHALRQHLHDWVATIPHSERPPVGVESEGAAEDAPSHRPARAARRAARSRLLEEAGPVLAELARRAWADEVNDEAARVLAALARGGPRAEDGPEPEEALTALRRLGPGPLAAACRDALAGGAVDLADLWDVTGIRPMRTALDGLSPSIHHRFERLSLLTTDSPLPGSLRRLARMPQIAPAYSMGLVGLRVRAAIGRLVLAGDATVVRSVARRPAVPMLCALTVHITCADPAIELVPLMPPRAVTVPGFPPSTLDDPDGPWRRAFPEARELGADTGLFWERIAENGLRVPPSWAADSGGWPVLWARAQHPGTARGARR